MTDSLVRIVNDTLFVDSRLIAQELGIQHESFMRTINSHKTAIEQGFGQLRFEIGTVTNSVKAANQIKYCLLTEDQATFIAMLSKNTAPVVKVKAKLVKDFSTAREQILAVKHSRSNSVNALISTSAPPNSSLSLYVDTLIMESVKVTTFDDLIGYRILPPNRLSKFKELQQLRKVRLQQIQDEFDQREAILAAVLCDVDDDDID